MSQMPGEDGQVDEYKTNSDYDETEIDGTGIDTDELALISVHSTRTSRCGRTLRAAVRLRGAGRSIIGGANIHIFVFCTINFF